MDFGQVTIQPVEFVYSPVAVDQTLDFFREPISLYTRHELVDFSDLSSAAFLVDDFQDLGLAGVLDMWYHRYLGTY